MSPDDRSFDGLRWPFSKLQLKKTVYLYSDGSNVRYYFVEQTDLRVENMFFFKIRPWNSSDRKQNVPIYILNAVRNCVFPSNWLKRCMCVYNVPFRTVFFINEFCILRYFSKKKKFFFLIEF